MIFACYDDGSCSICFGVYLKFVLLVLVVWRFVVKVSCIKFLLTDMSVFHTYGTSFARLQKI